MSASTQPPPEAGAAKTQTGPQQRIAALRANVLGGRGRGASQTELAAHQHQRVVFGGRPVTVVRERVALNTQQARAAPVDRAQVQAADRLAQLAVGDPPREVGAAPREQERRRPRLVFPLALGALIGFAICSRLRQRRGQQ